MLTCTIAHGEIKSLDIDEALSSPDIQSVVTYRGFPVLCGITPYDQPPIARDKVHYFGEPVALVVGEVNGRQWKE